MEKKRKRKRKWVKNNVWFGNKELNILNFMSRHFDEAMTNSSWVIHFGALKALQFNW